MTKMKEEWKWWNELANCKQYVVNNWPFVTRSRRSTWVSVPPSVLWAAADRHAGCSAWTRSRSPQDASWSPCAAPCYSRPPSAAHGPQSPTPEPDARHHNRYDTIWYNKLYFSTPKRRWVASLVSCMEPKTKKRVMKKTRDKKTSCSEETVLSWSPWSQFWGQTRVHGGKDVWRRYVLSREWKSEGVSDGGSGEPATGNSETESSIFHSQPGLVGYHGSAHIRRHFSQSM